MVASRRRWVADGGAVLLGNAIAACEPPCNGGFQGGVGLPMVALCYWGMLLQLARRLVMVASRRRWVADGGAVFWGIELQLAGCLVMVASRRRLANGGALLLRNAISGC